MRNLLLFCSLAALAACQSTPSHDTAASSAPRDVARSEASGDDSMALTTAHIDFAKWKRSPDCCTATGKKFAVAAAGTHAAQAALEMRDRGCNVVDAAVAASFTLAVERLQSTGIAGGGFLTLHLARPAKDGKRDIAIDFREAAPHRATRDMYLKDGKPVENLSRDGALAAGTPGFVAGLYEAYSRYGSGGPRCKWKALLQPAIRVAEKGFAVYPSLAEKISIRKDQLLMDPEAAKLLLPGGAPLAIGATLVQKDLARTLRAIAARGKDGFYRGTVAKQLVDYMRDAHGLIDEADLERYATKGPRFTSPLRGEFLGHEIVITPPPSAGGVAILESLAILSGFPLASETSRARYASLLAETFRRAYADRLLVGDPDFVHAKGEPTYRDVLTPSYADKARKRIEPGVPTASDKISPAELVKEESPHTAHVSVADDAGNAVSVTTTVNYFFGAARIVPGTGMFLNDEMDDFATQVGGQNITGLVGSARNAVEPYKVPVSSMAPAIVLKDGRPVLVVGAAGSSTIISSILQTIVSDLAIAKYDVRRAVFAGRVHHQWKPDKLMVEARALSGETEAKLAKMGYVLDAPKFPSQVQAVGIHPDTGEMTAVFDPRDEGGAGAR